MWNRLYSNRFCYEEDKFVDHKLFCERIAMTKSDCNTEAPERFKFLKVKASKHMADKQQQKNIEHNNNLLVKKIYDMERKHRHYHPSNQKFLSKASSYRFSQSSSKQREYELSDQYLKNRIANAKTAYSLTKSLNDYKKNVYIGSLIKRNSKYYNPFLEFATPSDFQRNLYQTALINQHMHMTTSPNEKPKRLRNPLSPKSYNDKDNDNNNLKTQQSWNKSLKTTTTTNHC